MSQTAEALRLDGHERTWSQAIAMETGIRVASCYQCMRCTNNCPAGTFMDIKPHQVIRLVQLGQKEKLLASSSIWLCLSCEMCSTYCPNEIEVAGLMNHLKNTVVATRTRPAEPDVTAFHEAFMRTMRLHGRMHDLELMQRFKWNSLLNGHMPALDELRQDLSLAWELLKRGRLKVLPEGTRGAREIRKIMKLHGRKETLR